jgi:vitamin K-dependent gamma-carboxylase-like protein
MSFVDRQLFVAMPAERLAALRILIGAATLVYVLVRFPSLTVVAHQPAWQFAPLGPVSVLSSPLPAGLVTALVIAAIPLGLAFTLGWRWRISGPAYACAFAWITSYRNSWGMPFHTENLMVLQLLVLACSRAADAWTIDRRDAPPPHGRYGAPIRLLAAITVTTYLIAGITKLTLSGPSWVTSDTLRNFVAYDNLRKAELGDAHSPFGVLMVRHAWMFPPLAAVSLAVELGAPLALVHARAARLWCFAAWGFHVGVVAIMWIVFFYPLAGLPFAPFFAPERLLARWSKRARATERPQRDG